MNVLDSLQSISVIVASAIAAGTVIYGINAWRREYTGKRKLQLAEEVLALFYEARDAIVSIRNPFSYVGEGGSRKPADNETAEERRVNDQANIVFERYGKHQDLFSKINAIRYRYMAQFGKDSAKSFDELNRIVTDIFASARMLAYIWKEQGHRKWESEEAFQNHLDEMHKHEAVFWEMASDKDAITPRLEAVISEIEAQSAKIIGKSK